MHEHSPSSEEKYLVRPRLIFTEAFEERIASHELSKSEEAFHNSRFLKYFTFIRHYKYAFSYGIAGSLIFGFIVGLVCIGFGCLVDKTLQKIKIHNEISAKNNEQYRKYKHSFLVQDCQRMIWQVSMYFFLGFTCYAVLITISESLHASSPLIMYWLKFTEPLTLKVALFIPSIDRYTEYLIAEKNHTILEINHAKHLMAISWFVTLLPFSLFLNYFIYLIMNLSHWYCYNYNNANTWIKKIKKTVLYLYAIPTSFGILYFIFRISFLGDILPDLARNSTILSIVAPYACVSLFSILCLAAIVCCMWILKKINTIKIKD